jgi:hypothetical protein
MTANPLGLIAIAIAAVVVGIVYLATQTRFFQTIWEGAMKGVTIAINWVKDTALAVFNWVKDNWPLLLAILVGPFGLAVLAIVKNFDTIKGAVLAVINWVKENWQTILLFLTGPIGAAIAIITKVFDVDLLGFLKGLPSQFYDAGKAMIEALGKGFTDAAGGAIDKVTGIVGKVRGLLPFSPAKWGPLKVNPPEQGGAKLIELLTQGILSQARNLERAAASVLAPLTTEPVVPNLAMVTAGTTPSPPPAPSGPAVVMEEVHFHEEVEVEDFLRKAAWYVQTERI